MTYKMAPGEDFSVITKDGGKVNVPPVSNNPLFNAQSAYTVGDLVFEGSDRYACISDVAAPASGSSNPLPSADSVHWILAPVEMVTGDNAATKAQLDALFLKFAPEWAGGTTYNQYNIVQRDGMLYYKQTSGSSSQTGAPGTDTTNWQSFSSLSDLTQLFLPLTGGTMTGTLGLEGHNLEIRIGNGGVDDDHARLSREELQVSNGAGSDVKLACYSFSRIRVMANGSTHTLTLPLATGTLALTSQLHYSYQTATVSSGTTPAVTDVADRAINSATLGSTVTAATVTLPAATPGKMRDFYVRLIIQSSTAPTIIFYDPATQAAVMPDNVPFGSSSLADIAPGDNLILFTEIEANKWLVSVKHEEAAS